MQASYLCFSFGRLINALSVGLIIAFSFWMSGHSSSDLQTRVLAIFEILILGSLLIVAALPQFTTLREYFRRDYSSKFYSSVPFSIALIAVDIPYITLAGTACVLCAYWAAGLESTPISGFYFWIMFIMFFWFCVSFGQLIGAASPNMVVAMLILPISNSFLFLFAGVLSPPQAMPLFWRSWMYWLDPDHWFLEGIITTVFHNLQIVCNDRDLFRFSPPNGTTCGEYTQPFFASGATGYIVNTSATDVCEYCSYKTGDEWFAANDWQYSSAWRNFGILTAYWLFNIIVSSILIYVFRKQSR